MSKVKFISDSHQYFTDDGRELISVSSFTDQFREKVDWKSIAKRIATKQTKLGEPTTTEDILNKWERKRNFASTVGTAYHTVREEELMKEENPVFYGMVCSAKQCEYIGVDKYSIPINKLENNSVYSELMIYDLDSMICGQADKVIVANKRINIWDYKTDTEIKYKAFSSKWVSPQKLLPPLDHLDDCNANIYSIKMSLYMYLLWKSNKGTVKTGDIIIEHIHLERDEDNVAVLVNGKPTVKKIENIHLPYRKKEVINMLKTLPS
jgi:hypothetical protein